MHRTDCPCPVCKAGRGERPRMETMLVKAPAAFLAEFREAARKRGLSNSEAVRRAIGAWMKEEE